MSPSPDRPQPTAYVIPFPCPLTTIRSHPATSKELLVADSHGSIFLTDWRSDPEDGEEGALRHSSLVELVEPTALSKASMAGTTQWSASVDWRMDAMDMYASFFFILRLKLFIFVTNRIGGVFGQKFALWDISKLRGGTPNATGTSFAEGGHLFRYIWLMFMLFLSNSDHHFLGGVKHTPITLPSRRGHPPMVLCSMSTIAVMYMPHLHRLSSGPNLILSETLTFSSCLASRALLRLLDAPSSFSPSVSILDFCHKKTVQCD